ncbi:endonuclease III [Candidatus Poribacteria bacterium]|nr:endonuclease III [Candidatus Poribacteria bacterium]
MKPNAVLAKKALAIADALAHEFPDARCALKHEEPLQLLVATILSAQCTDERVNMVTPGLFRKYPSALDFAHAPEGELENDIRSTGFFNNKAKAIRETCAGLLERFGGAVPEAMEDLLTLRGVARKTASVVRTNCFGYPGITVDTHFQRITQRLGLTKNTDPEKIEADVANILPPERWGHFSHAVILHGRKTCKARKPDCGACALTALCPSAFKCET